MRVIEQIGNPAVVVAEKLTADLLMDLVTFKVLAVQVPGFYNSQHCQAVADGLLASSMRGGYANAAVERVSKALFEAQTSEQDAKEYWDNSITMIETLRAECQHQYPTDLLRCRLDETWPGGCTLATFNGRRTNVGLSRIFPPGSSTEWHTDVVPWDIDAPEARQFVNQLNFNVHVQPADEGGEFMILPVSFDSKEDYKEHQILGSYGIREEVLSGLTPAVVRPNIGDLVMASSWLLHRVNISGGRKPRVTSSNFGGFESTRHPVKVFS